MELDKVFADLEDFPHSFQLEIGESESPLVRLQRQEEAALQAGHYKSNDDIARAHNFLAYNDFRQCKGPEALERTDTVLNEVEGQERNIVSLANKAIILWKMREYKKYNSVLKQLRRLRKDPDFNYLKILAKAELAECYGRLGHHVKIKAIELFKEIIPKGREPEVWRWWYGLALMYRQTLSLQHAPVDDHNTCNPKKILHHLLIVTANAKDDNTLKAKAYAEIAWLMFTTLDKDMKTYLQRKARLSLLGACDKALALDNTNFSVLWRTGRVFRSFKGPYLSKARSLLESAVAAQESTSAYHHLGLVYKSMAVRSQCDTLRKEALKEKKTAAFPGKRSMRSKRKWKSRHARKLPMFLKRKSRFPHSLSKEETIIDTISRIIKSPADKTTVHLVPGGEYVRHAVFYLRKAVEFSENENTRAVYDLALTYKAVGDLEEALKYFESICQREVLLSKYAALDVVSAYEQSGFIKLSQSREEEDNLKKKKLHEEGLSRLDKCLQISAREFSRVTPLGKYSKFIWKSVAILLKETDKSRGGEVQKVVAKIKLIKLIHQPKELRELVKLLPKRQATQEKKQKAREMQRTKKARATRKKKKEPAEEDTAVAEELFDDYYKNKDLYTAAVPYMHVMLRAVKRDQRAKYVKQGIVQEVCIAAAKQELLQNRSSARHPFVSVFTDVFGGDGDGGDAGAPIDGHDDDDDGARGSASATGDDDNDKCKWNVMVLNSNDDDAESTSQALAHILKNTCGLKVTVGSSEVDPGDLALSGTMANMDRSRVVIIVLDRRGNNCSGEDRALFDHAAQRPNVFVLNQEEHCSVPRSLKGRPKLPCSPALWEMSTADDGQSTAPGDPAAVEAICDLFSALTKMY